MIKEIENENLEIVLGKEIDITKIVSLRIKIWKEAGKFNTDQEIDDLTKINIDYHKKNLQNGNMVIPMILKKNSKDIVAIGIGIILEKPPVNYSETGKECYIYNVFTEQQYRGKGFAKMIIEEIIKFLKEKKVDRAFLISNTSSFELYNGIGFIKNEFYQEIKL